jgi:nitrogen-specific signal transduction histidine kinase
MVNLDISDRAALENQLAQARKLESVGRLAGGVAHDFNNILSIIIGHAELAMENVPPGSPITSDLRQILTAATKSTDIIKKLLAYARKQTITPKILNLNDAIEKMLPMLRRLIGENIDLAWLPEPQLPQIKMDSSQIDQILTNLCINSRDAISHTGTIAISTQTVSISDEFCTNHPGAISGDFVVLKVEDNGNGMDHHTMENLFEPFFTTKDIDKGTGLGLATVYGIIKQNSGFIHVSSTPGQGTTFTIHLPQQQQSSQDYHTEEEKKPEISAQSHETILLVEDEAAILHIATKMLKKLGYTVLATNSPAQALNIAQEHPGSIHLLLTDVIMPEMNGRDLAEEIFLLHPEIKSLFMSGYTADMIAHHGVLEDGVNFIQKPFTRKKLGHKLREILHSQ